ncbi:unknown protein [Seminavis robusta]|uniref:Uncharacterized protein n=1 Tax=Seminavis robusta TaxID=568900 RepID=A0A9N8F642_9STRA|nr:unknown protein [Seminavis robusta]|eukprot:Sro3931_g351920.1 n/a (195) ;mRNA; f:1020-1604
MTGGKKTCSKKAAGKKTAIKRSGKENRSAKQQDMNAAKKWKEKEELSKARKEAKDEQRKKEKKEAPKKPKQPRTVPKIGEMPELWCGSIDFHGADNVREMLTNPDGRRELANNAYKVPPPYFTAADAASRQNIVRVVRRETVKIIEGMASGMFAKDPGLIYHFVDVANRGAHAPLPVDNFVAAVLASLTELVQK